MSASAARIPPPAAMFRLVGSVWGRRRRRVVDLPQPKIVPNAWPSLRSLQQGTGFAGPQVGAARPSGQKSCQVPQDISRLVWRDMPDSDIAGRYQRLVRGKARTKQLHGRGRQGSPEGGLVRGRSSIFTHMCAA
eukprot:3346812-Rhodomonas_salina.1